MKSARRWSIPGREASNIDANFKTLIRGSTLGANKTYRAEGNRDVFDYSIASWIMLFFRQYTFLKKMIHSARPSNIYNLVSNLNFCVTSSYRGVFIQF